MPPVTFVTVRCPDASLIHLDIDLKTPVEDFRTILAPKSGIKRHKQRLVYAGRLMQDGRTLESYGIERNCTVHLLHTEKAPDGSPAGPGRAGDELSGLDISMIPPHLGTVQRHVLSNPDILQQMLESPAMQSLLNDHDFLRSLLKMDPRHIKLLEGCPELQDMLSDQEFMSQATESLRNPVHVRDVLRSTDRSMAQLDSLAGGSFDVLRQMCEDIERPQLDQPEINPALTKKLPPPPPQEDGDGEPDEELPAEGASTLPPAPEWLGTFDTNAMASMMQDQNMQHLLSQLVQTMNGPSAKIHPDDPFLDSGFIGQMFHAQTIDSMTKLQLAVEQLSMTADAGGAAAVAKDESPSPKAKAEPGGLRAKRAAATAKAAAGATGEVEPPADSPFVLSGLNPKSPAANFKEAFALYLAAEQESPEVRYKGQLQSMANMGFTDKEASIQALHNCDGNMNRAVEELIKQGKGK